MYRERDSDGDRTPVIVATARSPIGRAAKGSLKDLRPEDLAVQVLRDLLRKVPALPSSDIEELILGCGSQAGEQSGNLARVLAIALGRDDLPGTTVSRACASSLQSVRMAAHAIQADEGDVFISAGLEMVSAARRYDGIAPDPAVFHHPSLFAEAGARTARRAGGGADTWRDPRADGLMPDAYIAMGQTAENVAQLYRVSRRDQDEFAVRSQNLTEKAIADGFYEREITPVVRPDGSTVRADDGPRPGTTYEKVAALAPVFRPDGTVTAGNSCPLNDGAAAVVVMSAGRARDLGLAPLARIVATAVSGLSPEIMGLGPVEASRRVLERAGLTLADIDLMEINEAFAAQVLACQRELGLDIDRLNVHGGAIALGHPFGMTGARILTTLLNGLQARDARFGLETMCVGGGQGVAMIVERLG